MCRCGRRFLRLCGSLEVGGWVYWAVKSKSVVCKAGCNDRIALTVCSPALAASGAAGSPSTTSLASTASTSCPFTVSKLTGGPSWALGRISCAVESVTPSSPAAVLLSVEWRIPT